MIKMNVSKVKFQDVQKLPISILRYPGGKSRIIKQIAPYLPKEFEEYREPMVGGGSVFLYLKRLYPERKYWINDINYDLISFWKSLRDEPSELVKAIREIKQTTQDGKTLYHKLKKEYGQGKNDFEIGLRFYILNRITYSGLIDAGGFSELSFKTRFKLNLIDNLSKISPLLSDTKITCGPFEAVLNQSGHNVFMFVDPPYDYARISKIYGKKGENGTNFNHSALRNILEKSEHKWLLTYDDSLIIRKYYKKIAYIDSKTVQYGTNKPGNGIPEGKAKIGNELFIRNYRLSGGQQRKIV